MAITAISRDWGTDPSIVRIITTNNLAAITANGYLSTQEDNIAALNNGSFEWLATDMVLIYYSGGEGFFVRDAINDTFDAAEDSAGFLSDTLQDGDIFVGNALNVATGVTPSGDITLTNAGVFGIASGVIVNADVSASAAIAYSKLAALPSADILVGSAGNVATVRAVTGDIALSNTGVTSISAGVIVNADVNAAAAIDYSKLATLTSGNLLVGSAGNVATSVTMSGDATIIASGALTIANNAVNTTKLAINTVQHAQIALTAAEWNGMYTTPKLLIAAPGGSHQFMVYAATFTMTFVAAQYASGGAVALQFDSTAHGAGTLASATIAAATVNGLAASSTFQLAGSLTAAAITTTQNKGLYLSNQTGAFTTGDGTWLVDIWYAII